MWLSGASLTKIWQTYSYHLFFFNLQVVVLGGKASSMSPGKTYWWWFCQAGRCHAIFTWLATCYLTGYPDLFCKNTFLYNRSIFNSMSGWIYFIPDYICFWHVTNASAIRIYLSYLYLTYFLIFLLLLLFRQSFMYKVAPPHGNTKYRDKFLVWLIYFNPRHDHFTKQYESW